MSIKMSMKNRIIIGVVVVASLVFYVTTIVITRSVYSVDAQESSTLLPTPCGTYAIGSPVDSRFAPPYNLVSGYKGTNITPSSCFTTGPVSLIVGNSPFANMVSTSTFKDIDPAPVIDKYKKLIVAKIVYIYSPGSTGWKPLTNITSPDNVFFNSTINATWDYGHIKVNASTLVKGTHYVLGYSCVLKDGAWKCGCKNAACTEQGWQIQKVTVTEPVLVCVPIDPICVDNFCGWVRNPPDCNPDYDSNDPSNGTPCSCVPA